MPVAVKVTGEPVRLPLLAVRVLLPAVAPSVQLPTVAMPAALVVAEGPLAEPPPEATAKVTLTPGTGLPWLSVTMTLGGVLTAVPAVADWLSPALRAIWVAGPAIVVIVGLVPVRGRCRSPSPCSSFRRSCPW